MSDATLHARYDALVRDRIAASRYRTAKSLTIGIIFLIISIVHVESEGPYEPERLLPEAIKVMREKLAIIKQAAEALRDKSTTVDSDVVMMDA